MESTDNFERILEHSKLNLKFYRSLVTGITVYYVKTLSPINYGYIAIGTELIDTNKYKSCDGLPHTLEHLIFLGSRKYPYNGVIDSISNMCVSEGTNAYTSVDQTVYTFESASESGFLTMLPVFLDHILHPTLTDDSFLTEIHHVNGNGEDAGVVYCENQSTENTFSSILDENRRKLLFPNSGYSSNPFGGLDNLRQLTVNKVRDYHSDYYVPQNTAIIVFGDIDYNKLISISDDTTYLKTNYILERPWSKTKLEPITPSTNNIFYPNQEEESATIQVNWRQINFDDILTIQSIKILLKYLTDSSLSLLYKTFTESELCSSPMYDFDVYKEFCYAIEFDGIDLDKVDLILPLFNKTISDHQNNIDFERIHQILERSYYQKLYKYEFAPQEVIVDTLISHFLYSDRTTSDTEFNQLDSMLSSDIYLELIQKPVSYWNTVFTTYFVNNGSINIIIYPNKMLAEQNLANEKLRAENQKASFTQEQLDCFKSQLDSASLLEQISSDIFDQFNFAVPHYREIFNVVYFWYGGNAKSFYEAFPSSINCRSLNSNKINVQWSHIQSQFIAISIYLPIDNLPNELKIYIPLFYHILFNLPQYESNFVNNEIRSNINNIIDNEVIIRHIENISISYGIGHGIYSDSTPDSSYLPKLLCLTIKGRQIHYLEMIHTLYRVLYFSVFNKEKILIGITELISLYKEIYTDSESILDHCVAFSNFPNDIEGYCSIFFQLPFLKDLKSKYNSIFDDLKNKLELVRSNLLDSFLFHIIGDLNTITDPMEPMSLFHEFSPEVAHKTIYEDEKLLQRSYVNPSYLSDIKSCTILGLVDMEGVHFTKSKQLVDYDFIRDYVPLLVTTTYLSSSNSPIWKEIRGKGLAYTVSISFEHESSLLSYQLYSCTNLQLSVTNSIDIIRDIINKKPITHYEFLGAKNSVVHTLLSAVDSTISISMRTLYHSILNIPNDLFKDIMNQLPTITVDVIYDTMCRYILPLLSSPGGISWVVCPETQLDVYGDYFSKYEYDIIKHKNLRGLMKNYDTTRKRKDKKKNSKH